MSDCFAAALAVLFALQILPAAAQTLNYADLQSLAIEASWVEHFKWRYVGENNFTETPSPRTLKMKIASGGSITHTISRSAGGFTRMTDGDGPLGKVFSSGRFTNRWAFEDGKLVYIETLIEGARRLVITLQKAGDGWSCSLSATLAREEGKGKVISWHLGNNRQTEMTDISVQKVQCKVVKA